MKIKQLYSAFGSHFKIPFLKKYNLISYRNINEPVVMFGCYGTQIEVAFENKSKVKVIWAGSDCSAFIKNPEWVRRMKERPDIEHIAISHFIVDDLAGVGIPCVHIPIVPHDNSDIEPYPLGDSVYAYRSAYNPSLFHRLQKELPQFEFINAGHTTFTRKELIEVYKRCFIGVRFTLHDGCSNSVAELGMSGRRVIHNGGAPNTVPFDLANFEEIKQNIVNEYENRHSIDYKKISEETRKYLDVGEEFLKY